MTKKGRKNGVKEEELDDERAPTMRIAPPLPPNYPFVLNMNINTPRDAVCSGDVEEDDSSSSSSSTSNVVLPAATPFGFYTPTNDGVDHHNRHRQVPSAFGENGEIL